MRDRWSNVQRSFNRFYRKVFNKNLRKEAKGQKNELISAYYNKFREFLLDIFDSHPNINTQGDVSLQVMGREKILSRFKTEKLGNGRPAEADFYEFFMPLKYYKESGSDPHLRDLLNQNWDKVCEYFLEFYKCGLGRAGRRKFHFDYKIRSIPPFPQGNIPQKNGEIYREIGEKIANKFGFKVEYFSSAADTAFLSHLLHEDRHRISSMFNPTRADHIPRLTHFVRMISRIREWTFNDFLQHKDRDMLQFEVIVEKGVQKLRLKSWGSIQNSKWKALDRAQVADLKVELEEWIFNKILENPFKNLRNSKQERRERLFVRGVAVKMRRRLRFTINLFHAIYKQKKKTERNEFSLASMTHLLSKRCGLPIGSKMFESLWFYTFKYSKSRKQNTFGKLETAIGAMEEKGEISTRDRRKLVHGLMSMSLYKIGLDLKYNKYTGFSKRFEILLESELKELLRSRDPAAAKQLQKVLRFTKFISALQGHLPKNIRKYIARHRGMWGVPSELMEDIGVKDIGEANIRRFLKEKLKINKEHTQISKKEIAYFDEDAKDTLLKSLMRLADPQQTHNPGESLNYKGKSRTHPSVLRDALAEVKGAFSIEVPIWFKNKDGKIINGLIDLAISRDGAIYICDFKPNDEIGSDPEKLARHFWKYIPQITAYALMLQKLMGIDTQATPIYCVLFNKKGGWIFRPEMLAEFDKLIDSQGLAPLAMWREFFLAY